MTGLLSHLRQASPDMWRFSVFVGGANPVQFPAMTMRRAAFDTESPVRRIVWEQLWQPFQMGGMDLHHGLAFITPALSPVPAVATIYDLSFIHTPERLSASRRLYLRYFTALTCQRARRLIAISQSTARDLHQTLGVPRDRIDVALPGYDHGRFFPLDAAVCQAFRQAHDLPDRFWLFIGTLEPRKNLVMLLDAYAALPPHERLPLILAGGKGWDYAPIFERVRHYGLEAWVQFPGFIASDDLPFWYNCAETFIYPSIFEGFGLPVLEAMACGTPVMTTDISSLPEVIGEAGMQLSPNEPAAWTEALRRAAGDEQWRAQARARGLARATAFSWSNTAISTVKSYQQALGLVE